MLVSCKQSGKPKLDFSSSEKAYDELVVTFNKAKISFPEDSASLYNFYFKPAQKDLKEVVRDKKRLENLMSNENVSKYQNVHSHLKPLMLSILESDTISISQAKNFAELYSIYDKFQGESLFSQLINDDENYKLVWETLRRISHSSNKDTTYISLMIQLSLNIRTNAELSEAMEDFVVESIKNNPKGLLDMLIAHGKGAANTFVDYISYFDEPDKDLLSIYKEISGSQDSKYKNAATELLSSIPKDN